MVRTIVFLLLGVIALGVLATPGVAVVGLLLLLFLFGSALWWIGLAVTTHGRPSEAVIRTPRHQLLGPGGPDDPFAETGYEEGPRQSPRE